MRLESTSEHAAQVADAIAENARDVVAIANAMLVARQHDARRASFGLLVVAELLVQDDIAGRIMLAALAREMADGLDNISVH